VQLGVLGTWLWMKIVAFCGSIPEASQSMTMSSMLSRMTVLRSYSVVNACQSASEEEAFVLLLELLPVDQNPEVVPQVEASARPHAAQDPFAQRLASVGDGLSAQDERRDHVDEPPDYTSGPTHEKQKKDQRAVPLTGRQRHRGLGGSQADGDPSAVKGRNRNQVEDRPGER